MWQPVGHWCAPHPRPPGPKELLAFANAEADLVDMLGLMKLFMQLRMANVLELSVESKHALGKARVRQAKKATPELFNFGLLVGEMKGWMDHHPGNFDKFVQCFDSVRSIPGIINAFGMQNHPTCAKPSSALAVSACAMLPLHSFILTPHLSTETSRV